MRERSRRYAAHLAFPVDPGLAPRAQCPAAASRLISFKYDEHSDTAVRARSYQHISTAGKRQYYYNPLSILNMAAFPQSA